MEGKGPDSVLKPLIKLKVANEGITIHTIENIYFYRRKYELWHIEIITCKVEVIGSSISQAPKV